MRRADLRAGVWLVLALLPFLLVPSPLDAASARGVGTGHFHSCALTAGGGVKCWGANSIDTGNFGQLGDGTTTDRATSVDVVGLTGGVVSLSVGYEHACAVTSDGAVRCWGSNAAGQLGNGTTVSSNTPVNVTGLTSGAVTVSAGYYHTCALTTAGGVKCWGRNNEGQLGNGTTTSSSTPVSVVDLAGTIKTVAASGWNTCTLNGGGGAQCWGYNAYGSVGDGTKTNRSRPVDVAGLTAGAVTIAGGTRSTCALRSTGGVWCWGENSQGQLGNGTNEDSTIPLPVTGLESGVAALSVGSWHACAVLGTGALECWGNNSGGQLGNGTTVSSSTPIDVTGLAAGVAASSGGLIHSCALMVDGGVSCWGSNARGQLGDGTTTTRATAADVTGLAGAEPLVVSGAKQVTVGGYHACALTNAGGVWCWGENPLGQLGDGTITTRTTPVQVHGLASGVVAVAAGYLHTCALTSGGGIKCWGENATGQLGNGGTTDSSTPVDVSGLSSGVVAISTYARHTCALTTAGGVKCWGRNLFGGLGDGTTTNRSTPVDVTGLAAGVAAVAAGGFHACALTTTGNMKCWGDNTDGQLGNGTTTGSTTPVWVSGLTGIARVSAGQSGTCALTSGGGLKCWGKNDTSQLGDGTTTNRLTPVDVSGLASGVADFAVGTGHACSRTTEGRLQCWGSGGNGRLGDGSTTTRATPVNVSGLAVGAAAVAAGQSSTCAVTARGGVQCWGLNDHGQLGDGATANRSTPGWVRGLAAGAGMLAAGDSHGCRVTVAGGAQCWGYGAFGQLGDDTTDNHRAPVDVRGLASGVVAVAGAGEGTCALTTAGGVKCWGDNMYGALGDGSGTDQRTPVDVAGLAGGAVAISAKSNTACALTAAGGVLCWGYNYFGQVGDGTTTNRPTPVHVIGMTTGVTAVSVGKLHTCALRAGGAWCWGGNSRGQVGDGTTVARSTPTPVDGLSTGVASLAAGGEHTCALTEAGAVKCWGRNRNGQLGDTSTTDRSTPVQVTGLTSGLQAVSAGLLHTCAVTSGGGAWCWGYNYYGQLGDGSTTDRSTPVAVSGLPSAPGTIQLGANFGCAATATGIATCWGDNGWGQIGDGTTTDRAMPGAVRGFRQDDNVDADLKADVSVYRPSAGTWFALESSTGNASYQARGWGVQASGDQPVSACDFDGDGIVDPTVFRPSTGSWFILESSVSFTTWDYFGWGTTGDVPVPADYDGDGKTDAAVYRPSTGTWYVRPSGSGTQWNVAFGNATDVPIPGHYDSDARADIAVYRATTGTWFVLPSSTGYADYWYLGWGVQASGDVPAPGDYDGDGRMDLCVFRATTGTWFILESQHGFTTWRYFGWGTTGDTVVPADYDGDGITDAAVYRPSTYRWYIRPSSGAAQWSVVFGQSGDVPLVTIR